MSFRDFSYDQVKKKLGVSLSNGKLFPDLTPSVVPEWLPSAIARGMDNGMQNEKARSEFIIAPVLLAFRETMGRRISVLSGTTFNVDAANGLNGECDFILAPFEPLPVIREPLLTIVEAKREDIEAGVPQCLAQMVAARIYNEGKGLKGRPVFGCVTSGEIWAFLRIDGSNAMLDTDRFYLGDPQSILAALRRCVEIAGEGII